MKYAVCQIAGKQYKVAENSEIEVSRLQVEKDKNVEFENVLLLRDEDKLTIGTPFIKGARIMAKIIDHLKGPKVRVAKFKAKSRYRRVTGFRPQLTKVKIEKIIS